MGRVADTLDFRFGLGHPVLEFLATVGGRLDEPHERLATRGDLDRWLAEAGLVGAVPRCSGELLLEAQRLREAVFSVLDAARRGRRLPRADLELVNGWARQPAPSPQLDSRLNRRWIGPDPARAALGRLAASAIELVSGSELARVSNCASPTCSLLFIDRSRPGRRRWCSMERCGNRSKTARYRRHRLAGDAASDAPARRPPRSR